MSLSNTLSFVQGDARWTALRKRCLSDLYFFAETVLGYGELIPMDPATHGLYCKFLERKTSEPRLDECPFRKVEMPRGIGKTAIETKAHTIQRLCANPNLSILIVNEREQNAKDFLAEIKHHFMGNELLRALFPEVCPDADLHDDTWAGTRINVKRSTGRSDPSVFIIGVGGTVTGMHPDIIIVDDMISREAMENARVGGGQLMEQVNRWLHQLKPLLNYNHRPFPEIVFVGTRWWFGDSYEHIEEWLGYGADPEVYLLRWKLPSGETQTLEARRIGDLAVFRRSAIEDGKSIAPTKWDLETLAKLRMEDPVLFAANYMNRPTDDVTAIFKPTWVQHYTWENDAQIRFIAGDGKTGHPTVDSLERTIYVDPGGFGRSGSDRARAAIVTVGDDHKGHYFLLDAFSERESFLNVIKQIVVVAQKYQPRKVKVEQVAQQASFVELLRQAMRDAGIGIPIEIVTPKNRDKDQRILQLEPFFQRGMVYIGTGPGFQELRSQLEQFPNNTRKDLLDALAYAADDWARTAKIQKPEQRIAQELATYRERRGLTYGA